MAIEQDGQMLFEHTMRKPQSFTAPVDRFFVIRQEVLAFSWPFVKKEMSVYLLHILEG